MTAATTNPDQEFIPDRSALRIRIVDADADFADALARLLRHKGHEAHNLIAVTGHGSDAARTAAAEIGIDVFLLDPTHLDDLLADVDRSRATTP